MPQTNEMIDIYAHGMTHCSVCVPAELSRDEVEKQVNICYPAGGSLRWTVSRDTHFRGGQPNPCPCQSAAGRLHYLMEC